MRYLLIQLFISIHTAFVGPETVASVDSQDENKALVASGPPPPSKEEEEPNPRAALMMMLNKRSPPTPTEDEPTTEPEKSNKDEVSKKDDSEEEPNPRAALMSMPNKRSQPPTPVEEEESKAKVEKDDKEEAEPDPRASLIKMLGKRQVNDESAVAEDTLNKTSVPGSPGTGFFPATTPTTSSPSTTRKGFFPATSPKSSPKARVNQSTREKRYEEKTSSIARASDAVTASPPQPSVVPPEKRKDLYEVIPAIVSSSETEPKKRANRINPHVEADAKTEAKVMLVAAMAASSARNKSPGTAMHDETISSDTDTKQLEEKPQQAAPMGIAAMAAAAARKKNEQPGDKPPTVPTKSVESTDKVSKPTPPPMPDLSSNDEKATAPSGLQCSACGKYLEKKNYSKSQLSKKEKRRCKTCIENQRQISPAGN